MVDKKILLRICILALLMLFLSVMTVTADRSLEISTANLSEFNTLTPTITFTPVGNLSTLKCHIYNSSGFDGDVISYGFINATNNTATTVTFNTSLPVRTAQNYGINCTTGSGAGTFSNSSFASLSLNGIPVLSSASIDKVTYERAGSKLNFTATWLDQNYSNTESGDDNVALYVCSTPAVTGGSCSNKVICSGTIYMGNFSQCSYTIPTGTSAGRKTAYAFAIDNNNYASVDYTTLYYYISTGGYIEDVGVEGIGTSEDVLSTKAGNWGKYIVIGIGIFIVYLFLFSKKKRR